MTLLITTGGTIDSHRDTKQQMIAPLRHTTVPDAVHTLGLSYDEYIALCAKDARDVDIHDLTRLQDIIRQTDHQHIIITHGYQTIVDTMRVLEEVAGDKSITLVGSLIPLSETGSDALEQLVAAWSVTAPGVYAIRKSQAVGREDIQHLLYHGEVQSKWFL